MNTYNLVWLMEWYSEQCDGDWEHSYGIKIETIDNPGWFISIDIQDTKYKQIEGIAWHLVEQGDEGWYGYKVSDGRFEASGDPTKLDYLIQLFREIITGKSDDKRNE